MPDEPAKKGTEATPPKAPKRKLPLLLIVALVVLGGGGAGGWFFLKHRAGSPPADAPSSVEKELVADAQGKGGHGPKDPPTEGTGEALLYKFQDEFVVNLLDPRGREYLQANLQFKATSPQALKQLELNDAPLRDAIIMLLSSKRRDELETPAGKERVKRELLARVEGIVDAKAVSDVYFTKWLLISQ